jgi:dihydroxy-acid dehydratase
MIALVAGGDQVKIDIPHRELTLDVPDAELSGRRERLGAGPGGFRPAGRHRPVSQALQVYAALATSASTGAVRDLGSFSPMPAHAEGPAPGPAAG